MTVLHKVYTTKLGKTQPFLYLFWNNYRKEPQPKIAQTLLKPQKTLL